MRLSASPRVGTVSACSADKRSGPCAAAATARIRRAARAPLLRIMMRILIGRSVDGSLRLRLELDDFEPERIPAPRARILRRLGVRVLDGRHPVTELILGAGADAKRLEIADLCEIGETTRTSKETHRLDLHAHCAA